MTAVYFIDTQTEIVTVTTVHGNQLFIRLTGDAWEIDMEPGASESVGRGG